jgi:hypothetical protein
VSGKQMNSKHECAGRLEHAAFLKSVQCYVANIAIGASTLRNQGAKKVIEVARQFLAGMDLNCLKGMKLADYPHWLDDATHTLQKRFPRGARTKWGAARKAINVFMCHAFMNRELSTEYGLIRLGEVMETPLDKLAAKKLCEWAGRRELPPWRGVGCLTPEVSRAYQEFALTKAREKAVPRACLDVLLWTRSTGASSAK